MIMVRFDGFVFFGGFLIIDFIGRIGFLVFFFIFRILKDEVCLFGIFIVVIILLLKLV